MSISTNATNGLAAGNGALALLDNPAPISVRHPTDGTTSADTEAWAMFAAQGAGHHVAPRPRHAVGHGVVADRRHAAESDARVRRAAVDTEPNAAPNTAPDTPAEPHTIGMRALQATLGEWHRAGKHQDLVAAYLNAAGAGDRQSSVEATTRRVALYDAVIKAWRQDGTFDKVVAASVEVLKQGGVYERIIQRFRDDYHPELGLAKAEEKFLADFADWDSMSPTDKRIRFIFYKDPRRMLSDG
jgi:hypothetical protein